MGLLSSLYPGCKFQVYKDHAGQFRFRFIAANNRIIANSGEGYYNKKDCLDAINLIKANAPSAPIDDLT